MASRAIRVVRVPRLPSVSRAGARRFARRAGSAVVSAAKEEKHTVAAGLAALAFGYAERTGKDGKSLLSKLPKLPGLSPTTSAAALAFALTKVGPFKGNRTARHVATGLIAVAAYKLGRDGIDSAASGDDDDGADDYAGNYGD